VRTLVHGSAMVKAILDQTRHITRLAF
jgi:hypothetical protein